MVGLTALYPVLWFMTIAGLAALSYSVYLLYSGVPIMMNIPEEKGFVRVAQVEGYWKFVPKGDNLTEVTYQVHTEPGGSVPSWLANKFVVDAPFNTLKALKEHAEQ